MTCQRLQQRLSSQLSCRCRRSCMLLTLHLQQMQAGLTAALAAGRQKAAAAHPREELVQQAAGGLPHRQAYQAAERSRATRGAHGAAKLNPSLAGHLQTMPQPRQQLPPQSPQMRAWYR